MDESTAEVGAVEQQSADKPVAKDVDRGEKQDTATKAEVSELYKDLGIDAPVPTGKTKGRPKSSSVRAKDAKAGGDKDTESGRQEKAQSNGEQKDAPTSDKDGDLRDDTDEKGEKGWNRTIKYPDAMLLREHHQTNARLHSAEQELS